VQSFSTNVIFHTILSFEKKQRFLLKFGVLSPNLFLDFSQVSEIILNESSKKIQNALNGFGKTFLRNKVYVVSLVLRIVFETTFGIFSTPLVRQKSVKYGMSANF
jgi:hypothetical protein